MPRESSRLCEKRIERRRCRVRAGEKERGREGERERKRSGENDLLSSSRVSLFGRRPPSPSRSFSLRRQNVNYRSHDSRTLARLTSSSLKNRPLLPSLHPPSPSIVPVYGASVAAHFFSDKFNYARRPPLVYSFSSSSSFKAPSRSVSSRRAPARRSSFRWPRHRY